MRAGMAYRGKVEDFTRDVLDQQGQDQMCQQPASGHDRFPGDQAVDVQAALEALERQFDLPPQPVIAITRSGVATSGGSEVGTLRNPAEASVIGSIARCGGFLPCIRRASRTARVAAASRWRMMTRRAGNRVVTIDPSPGSSASGQWGHR